MVSRRTRGYAPLVSPYLPIPIKYRARPAGRIRGRASVRGRHRLRPGRVPTNSGALRTQTDASDVGINTPIDLPDPSFAVAATDFRAKNASRGSVDPNSIPSLHELRKATQPPASHASPALPYITVSRVGMDRERGRAVLYVGMACGILCGQGEQIWLERTVHGRWRVMHADVVWVS